MFSEEYKQTYFICSFRCCYLQYTFKPWEKEVVYDKKVHELEINRT